MLAAGFDEDREAARYQELMQVVQCSAAVLPVVQDVSGQHDVTGGLPWQVGLDINDAVAHPGVGGELSACGIE